MRFWPSARALSLPSVLVDAQPLSLGGAATRSGGWLFQVFASAAEQITDGLHRARRRNEAGSLP